jgi:hypothetical protein
VEHLHLHAVSILVKYTSDGDHHIQVYLTA